MEDLLLVLNQPLILRCLFGGAILAVLIDYLFPVDWLAYVGYVLFGIFVGATLATTPVLSALVMVVVVVAMFLLHKFLFSKYLTNAPRIERQVILDVDGRQSDS